MRRPRSPRQGLRVAPRAGVAGYPCRACRHAASATPAAKSRQAGNRRAGRPAHLRLVLPAAVGQFRQSPGEQLGQHAGHGLVAGSWVPHLARLRALRPRAGGAHVRRLCRARGWALLHAVG